MLDELRRANLLPDPGQADLSVDIEAFVETHLGLALDVGAVLDADVLGMTEFVPGRHPKISISRDLTGSALASEDATFGLIGRWRATVAHEASHVVLHRVLFEVDQRQNSLFHSLEGSDQPDHLMRCLNRDVSFQDGPSDWKEVQANRGMAALLMPKPVFVAAFDQEAERLNATERPIAQGSPQQEWLVGRLASRFTVSKQAARIRLTTVQGVRSVDQLPI